MNSSVLPDTMDTVNESFFIDTFSDGMYDEAAQSLSLDSLGNLLESRDTDCGPDTLHTTAEPGLCDAITTTGHFYHNRFDARCRPLRHT